MELREEHGAEMKMLFLTSNDKWYYQISNNSHDNFLNKILLFLLCILISFVFVFVSNRNLMNISK